MNLKTIVMKNFSLVILAVCIFYDASAQFVVFNNGAEVTVSQGCIVTIVTGDLDNDNGTIDNAGRITVDGDLVNSDVLTGAATNTGIFNVAGDWENNSVFTADQSLVNLNGASQTVTGTQISSFYNLNLLGSGIKSLDLDAEVNGVLQLNNLELATDVNTLRVLNGSSTAVTENGGFVSSLGAGRMAWSTNSTDTYVFPLGSSVGTPRIRPVAITPASTSPNIFEARFANVDATSEGFDVSQISPNLCFVNDAFYHLIDQTSGSDAADITHYYVLADDGDWSKGAHWQSTPQWEDMMNETIGTAGGYNTITNLGWSDFSNPAFALSNALPDVAIDAVAPLCESADPVALNASPAGGDYFGAGVSNGMFDPNGAGQGTHTITYVYTDQNGCSNTASIDIEVGQAPVVTVTSSNSGSLELCDGESMDLTASSGFVDYTWSPSGSGSTITVTDGGQYYVIATDANGCQSTSAVANVTVHSNPEPVITANGPVNFCEGESVVLSTAPNQGTYEWEITNGIGSSTQVTQSGDYFVTVTNEFGCVGVSNTITVDVTPMDEAVILENGNDLTVDPPGSGYQWFLNGDPIPGATGIEYTAIQSGNYHVEYIGPNGCPTSTYVLEFTLQTGVDELSIFDVLEVYPNPGEGQFTIRGQMPTYEEVTIELTNMLGQALQPAVVIGSTNNFIQPMDISSYANGVYFIRIHAADSSVTVRYIKS
ncbi:MAG: T9SS type A sorting domain-containing protein [Flavobacteriales bacterium]|nr:T9SS type A sorting domain-containing protein [Flavobacteriales bacterium]